MPTKLALVKREVPKKLIYGNDIGVLKPIQPSKVYLRFLDAENSALAA